MNKFLIICLSIFTFNFAHAGLLIEPYAGMHLNSSFDVDGYWCRLWYWDRYWS